MGTLLDALRRLQTIEQDLDHVRRRMRIRKNAVAIQQRKIEQFESDYASLHAQILGHRKEADSLELDLREKEERVTKYRGGLNASRSNKEYATILTQINTLRADNARIEDQAIKIIQDADALQEESKEIRRQIEEQQKHLENVRSHSEEELLKLNVMAEELSARRAEAIKGISPQTLSVFERVSESYSGESMAPIEVHGRKPPHTYVCGGCFMSLNSEHANALRIRDEVRTCDNCGRILYVEPQE